MAKVKDGKKVWDGAFKEGYRMGWLDCAEKLSALCSNLSHGETVEDHSELALQEIAARKDPAAYRRKHGMWASPDGTVPPVVKKNAKSAKAGR